MVASIKNYQFLEALKALPFVEEIWLFGSRARGDHHDRSDIDLAIICPQATDLDWIKITNIIDNADTLLKIDCLRFEKDLLSDEFYNNILQDKRILYMKDIFWKNSFDTLGNAIIRLNEVITHPDLEKNDFMRDAAIQRFEFTIELFWKTLKKILAHEKVDATTPRDTINKAYQYSFIDKEDVWLGMLDDRNNKSHAYKEAEAKIIFDHIKSYLPVFEETYQKLKHHYQL